MSKKENHSTEIFDQLPIPLFFLKGKMLTLDFINVAGVKDWGHLLSESLGISIFKINPFLQDNGFRELAEGVMQEGHSATYSLKHLFPNLPVVEEVKFQLSPWKVNAKTNGIILTPVINNINNPDCENSSLVEDGMKQVSTSDTKNEQELIRSILEFKNLADAIPVIVWLIRPDGKLVYLNAQWFSYTGLPENDPESYNWIKMVCPEDVPEVEQSIQKAMEEKSSFNFSLRLKNKKDEFCWCFCSGRARYHPDGDFEGLIGSIVNIHEQKIAEESAARLVSIVEHSNDAIISKTLEGIITSWNPAAERLFGYLEEEMIGQSITKLIPPDRHGEEVVIINRLQNGEIVEHFDTMRLHKDGTLLDISITISPIKDNSGHIIGASKIARDVRSQKILNAALKESEEKFRQLVMQAPMGITIMKGPDFVVEIANPAYLQLVDKQEEEFVGLPLFESLPEVEESIGSLLEQVMKTGEAFEGQEFPVYLNRFGKKDIAYFNFIYKPFVHDGEEIAGIIVIANDVTRQVEGRHELAESEKEFRRLVTQSPIAMTIWRGPEYIIEMANREMFQHIWRKEEKDVLGRKAMEVFPELMDQKYPELLKKVYNTGQIHREEEAMAYIEGDDGMRKFYLDFEYAPLFEPDGKVSGIMITVYNVTEKVEARQKVEDAEARLRMAAEGTGLATWDLNLVTRDIINSPRLIEIFGHPPGVKLTHAEMREQVLEEDRISIVEPAFSRAIQTGIYDYEARVVKPDNSICWIRTQGRVIFDSSNKPQRMLGTMRDITEQKNVQKAIAESESRLNIAVESAELGTWEVQLPLLQLNCSNRFLQIMGFPDSYNLSYEELMEKIYPADKHIQEEGMQRAIETGTLEMEIRIVPHADNKIRWIRATGRTFYDEQSEPVRVLGTIMDLTEQKNSMERVKESEERFKTIANTAPVMIWMSGNDKFSDFFNTRWLSFTGKKMEEEVGDGWLQNVHPDDVPHCVEMYNSSFSKNEPFYIEYRLLRKDGQYRWIADNAVPRYDAAGNFIGFISACMDIDDEKRFNQRLQASELLFKTISNVSPVGLWMTNSAGENTFVNDTWAKWTGTGRGDKPDKGWVNSLLEADKQLVVRQFLSKAEQQEKFSAEFRFKRADGSVRWGLSEGFPYYFADGSFAGYAGSVTDITDRKLDEFRKNDFLAVASHELKTPITSIKAYAQLLASTYEKTNDQFLKNALGKVENQVNKMSKLVGDFLNLSKIESERFQLNKEAFLLNELVTEIVADSQLVSTTHEIQINANGSAMVYADREKIAQVLTNLLSNAVKYSPGEKMVEVVIDCQDEEVILSVIDNGIGIAKNEEEKIFERFYRAGANNIQFSGFGIGLYISAEIIRKHEGEIAVKPNKGKGSRFYFKLALAK